MYKEHIYRIRNWHCSSTCTDVYVICYCRIFIEGDILLDYTSQNCLFSWHKKDMTKYGFLCMIDRSGYSNNINFISFVMFWIRSTPCLKGGMTFAYNLQILFISVYFGLFRHKHDGNPKGKNFFISNYLCRILISKNVVWEKWRFRLQ